MLSAAALVAAPLPALAQAAPSCDAVHSAFTAGSYERREAIVDALQDRFKAGQSDRSLGRDGKVQAIMLALTRCQTAPSNAFMPMLDQASIQVAQERARRHGD